MVELVVVVRYHVGNKKNSIKIFAGPETGIGRSGWTDDVSDVTDEALVAVVVHMVRALLGDFQKPKAKCGSYFWDVANGKVVELRVILHDISEEEE